MESIHRRSIFVPNTPNDSFLHNFNKTRSKPLFLDENLGNSFTSNPLSELIRLPAEQSYAESSSSRLLLTADEHEDSAIQAMNRLRTTEETSLVWTWMKFMIHRLHYCFRHRN